LQEVFGSVQIVNAFRYPVIISEIELRKVSVKVLSVAVVIDAVDTSFQYSEIAFYGVGGYYLAVFYPDVFFCGMVHLGVLAAEAGAVQNTGFVGHQVSILGDHLVYDRPEAPGSNLLDVVRLHRTTALYKGKDRSLIRSVGGPIFRAFSGLVAQRADAELSADIGFIAFDNPAEWAIRLLIHSKAETVRHKPSGLESDTQGPMKLIRAYAFFRSRHEIQGLKPVPQRNMTILEDSSDRHRKRLTTGIAFIQSFPGSLAVEFAYAGLLPAMRANRTFGPQL
jgi:hypothetical protein